MLEMTPGICEELNNLQNTPYITCLPFHNPVKQDKQIVSLTLYK